MFILRHFRYYINNETLRTEVHFIILSASQLRTDVHFGSFCHNIEFAWIRKIPHRGSFLFSFSASQLRTAVHIWPFCHHLEFETLRIEVHFCSLIVHLSFAPRFILSSVSVHRGGCSANVFSDEHVRLVRRELSFAPRLTFGRFITISRSKHCAPRLIFYFLKFRDFGYNLVD